MLGVVMYWTALVIEPTYTLLEEAAETQQAIDRRAQEAIEQNQLLMENQDNNTARLEKLLTQHADIMDRERNTTADILNNITRIYDTILLKEVKVNESLVNILIEKQMREWVANMSKQFSQP